MYTKNINGMYTRNMMFPRASDRETWKKVHPRFCSEIITAGEALASDGGYPSLTAVQYMAYVRTGNRRVFEVPFFDRRHRLIRACLAECVAGDGRYLDTVIDGLWCICEESTWCISAHNLSEQPLPDIESPTVDLFAAQTAALVSWVCYLLEDKLLPLVIRRVLHEVQLLVLEPFLKRDDFWWMGVVRRDLNNWTPWILSNVLSSAHIWVADDDTRASFDVRASLMLDRWLACIPEDGGLDEGVAYWNMAGGSLLDCLEHLGVDRYDEPKIRNLSAYPLHAHIAGPYFVNYADCDAQPLLDGERIYQFGEHTKQEALMAFGASIALQRKSVFQRDTPEFYRTLCALFCKLPDGPVDVPPMEDVTLSDLQLWIRQREGLYVAFKGGHNGENHNHNDVGSIIVYANGKPAIIDVGNMVYTASTFDERLRYTLLNTRSANHNVPLIGDYEQAPGCAHAAHNVMFDMHVGRMDIACAYPEEAGVERFVRTVDVTNGIVLTDDMLLHDALPVTWVFMLHERPDILPGVIQTGSICLFFREALEVSVEEVPVTDARMARNYHGSLWRLTLKAACARVHYERFMIQISKV